MSSLPTAFTISPVVEPTKEDSLRLEYLSEAEFMDRHVRTTHRWQSQRIGPPLVKFGKIRLYRRSAVEAWLRSLEVAGPDPRHSVRRKTGRKVR